MLLIDWFSEPASASVYSWPLSRLLCCRISHAKYYHQPPYHDFSLRPLSHATYQVQPTPLAPCPFLCHRISQASHRSPPTPSTHQAPRRCLLEVEAMHDVPWERLKATGKQVLDVVDDVDRTGVMNSRIGEKLRVFLGSKLHKRWLLCAVAATR